MYPSPVSNPWVGEGGLVNVTRVAPPVVFTEKVAYRLMALGALVMVGRVPL